MSRPRHATHAAGGHRTPRQEHAEAVGQLAAVLEMSGRPPEPCPCDDCTRPAHEPRHLEVCRVDGYPMGLDCTCGHGHDRHVGGQHQLSPVRCMSYTGQPDCTCITFTPQGPVQALPALAALVQLGAWA